VAFGEVDPNPAPPSRRRPPRGWIALAALALVLGCKSDLKRVADFGAATYYHEQRYRAECVDVKGPETCAAFKTLAESAAKEAGIDNETQKRGKLPPTAKKRIRQFTKALEAQP
jgi:hypothetical protein